MELFDKTISEMSEMLNSGKITSEELVNQFFDRIDEKEGDINAFISLMKDEAIARAKEIDLKRKNGEKVGKYAGIPIAIKDNMNIKGTNTTCASKMLENYNSPYNATVIDKLEEAGLIFIGKTNMDEFAMGTSTEHSAFKITHNPWDLERIPGGSSGGSAAAVSAQMAPWALGSDTGGSIRQPASMCGVVGLKPTYGLVSRYGLVAYASSFDQIGPIASNVEDSAILLNLIAGYDENDSTSYDKEKEDYTKYLVNDVKGMKIVVPKEFIGEGINEDVKKAIIEVADNYRKMGATVDECSLDVGNIAIADYYILACAEASSNLGRFDGIRYGYRTENYDNLDDIYLNSRSEGFGPEVKRRIILGTYVLSAGYYDAYYKKAQKVRAYLKAKFNELFDKYDLVLIPTVPSAAFKIGEKIDNPLEMYLADICTVSVNIIGSPAMNIPCALDSNGVPIGFQLIGKAFNEKAIFQAAYTYEQNYKFDKKPTFRRGDKNA